MTKYIISTFLSLLFLTGSITSFGQSQKKSIDNGVVGSIVEGKSKKAIQFASVSVISLPDSVFQDGTITDQNGEYKIELSDGKFAVLVEFMGYGKTYSEPFTVSGNIVKLDPIEISQKAETLQEAVVEAERSEMALTMEKKTFEVSQDITSQGGSASDILENVPSVTVDNDGSVSLRGNSNVRILINGKQSGLVGVSSQDALRMLASDMVERVEVITNPSARYDAEGMAGIINIILKKDKEMGTNAVFTGGARYPWGYNASASLTHKRGDWSFSGNYSFRDRARPRYSEQRRQTLESDTAVTVLQDDQGMRSGQSHNIMGGVQWSPDEYNEFSFDGVYSTSHGNNTSDVDYRTFDPFRLRSTSLRENDEIEDEENYDLTFEHRRTFPEEKREWVTSLDYNTGDEIEDTEAEQRFYGPSGNEVDSLFTLQNTYNREQQDNFVFQSDYVHPFSENGKVEFGVKSSWRVINTNYFVEDFDPASDSYERLPRFSNDFLYDEQIHAAYGMYSNKWGKFGIAAGLRAEWSVINVVQEQTNDDIKRDYINPFPTLSLSYELDKVNTVQLSYSRRINRPGFWDLNPFFSYTNPLYFRSGNPKLNPEYTNSLEATYLFFKQKGNLNISTYYRHSTGVIQRVSTIEDGVTISRPQNVTQQENFGLELTGMYRPFEWWRVGGSVNYYGSRLDASNVIENGNREFTTWQSQLNTQITTPGDIKVQLRANHRAATVTAQGIRKNITYLTAGVSRSFFDDKFAVNFNVRDVFNSRKYRGTTIGDGFVIESEGQWRPRTFTLSLTYRLKNEDLEKGKGEGDFGGGDY